MPGSPTNIKTPHIFQTVRISVPRLVIFLKWVMWADGMVIWLFMIQMRVKPIPVVYKGILCRHSEKITILDQLAINGLRNNTVQYNGSGIISHLGIDRFCWEPSRL